jgi:hypothetical protein
MTTFLLIVAPFFLLTPGLFNAASATPKALSIAVGLYLACRPGWRKNVECSTQVLVFLGICVLSCFYAVDQWTALTGCPKSPYFGVYQCATVAVAYYLASDMANSPNRILVRIGAILGLFAVVQAVTGHSFLDRPLQLGRAEGFRYSPVMFAASLIPCALCAWDSIADDVDKSTKVKNGLLFIPIVFGMLAAQAKGALFATIVGIWVYETEGWKRWGGVAAALAVLYGYMFTVPTPTNLERIELLKIAWRAFKTYPILGWGPDSFLVAFLNLDTTAYAKVVSTVHAQASAHQDIAQVAATLGLAGLAAYLWMLWSLVKASEDTPLAIAVLVAYVAQAQVNPIPVDVMVVGALIVGAAHGTDEDMEFPAWIGPVMLAIGVMLAVKDLVPR